MNQQLLKTPEEWEKIFGIEIIDPDGWRYSCGNLGSTSINEKISKKEFDQRMLYSTIRILNMKRLSDNSR